VKSGQKAYFYNAISKKIHARSPKLSYPNCVPGSISRPIVSPDANREGIVGAQ
jgi:hypothetical protein